MRTMIGDVFVVEFDNGSKRYLQYIANDLTQLNSDVVRVFKRLYGEEDSPSLSEVVNDEVDFFAHCATSNGVKQGVWEKFGNVQLVGPTDILFRDSRDYGNPTIKISSNWWVWRIGEEQRPVGKLEGENKKADIGIVIPPQWIVRRMTIGEYHFQYPSF